MKFAKVGTFCGAEFGTELRDRVFYLRIEARPVVAAIVQSMGWYAIYEQAADEGAASWFLIPYNEEIDEWLVRTIDVLIAARRAQPKYGQVRLEMAA